MKQALVQTIDQGGNTYGQVSSPTDLMKAQEFVHDRITGVTKDFLNGTTDPDIKGFSFSLGAGNAFNITIQTPGRIYIENGVSFDLLTNATVTFDAADASLPRHDLVIAKIEDDIDAEPDSLPFVRLRTSEELSDGDPAYPPTNITAPTEKHWRATIQIKKGTPAASPEVPELGAGEIPLYRVMITPQSTSLVPGDVLDLRNIAKTVRQLNASDSTNRTSIADIYRRLVVLEQIGTLLINIGGDVQTLEEYLAELLARTSASADLPEVRYDYPKFDLFDKRSAMIQATPDYIASQGIIDFELGLRVNFGDTEVALVPDKIDPAWNPRYVVQSGSPVGHVQREVALTPSTVTDLGSDAAPGFTSRLSSLLDARYKAAAAARDERYIEIFGGINNLSGGVLSDWQTYDTENDTIATRTVTGDAIPASKNVFMYPCGDGEHVLVCSVDTGPTLAKWFRCKVDGTNVVSTRVLTGDVPTGTDFMGDLVRADLIFIVGVDAGDSANGRYYHYHIEDNEFTQVAVTVPTGLQFVTTGGFAGCHYKENEFIFVTSTGIGVYRTYLYNVLTSSIVQLTGISEPWAGRYTNQAGWATGFMMANVNNRPMLIGGNVFGPSPTSSWAYELLSNNATTRPIDGGRTYWNESVINVPARWLGSFVSTIGGDGLPTGVGFSLGGRGMQASDVQPVIYGSTQNGLIGATYNGEDGITIGANASYGSFEIPAYVTAGQIFSYFASLRGRNITNESVKISVSFDGGTTWHDMLSNQTIPVTDSSDPADRRFRITLYRNGTTTPVLTALTEAFDEDSEVDLEGRTMIRIDTPEDDNFYAMYMDRRGNVTFLDVGSNTLLPSSPARCLLMQIIATADDAPTLTPLINRRRPVETVLGTKTAAASESIYSNLAVPFRHFELRGIVASGKHLYRPPTQTAVTTSNFRSTVTVLKTEIPESDQYEIVFYG